MADVVPPISKAEILATFRGAQLFQPIELSLAPQPVALVYVDPAYHVRPYLSCYKTYFCNGRCCRRYTPFLGPLGNWKHSPMDSKLLSPKKRPITCEESNRLPCLPVDSFDVDQFLEDEPTPTDCSLLLDYLIGWRIASDKTPSVFEPTLKPSKKCRCPECHVPLNSEGFCKRARCIFARRFATAAWLPEWVISLTYPQHGWLESTKLRPTQFEGVSERERATRLIIKVRGTKSPSIKLVEWKPVVNLSALPNVDLATDKLRAVLRTIYSKEGRKFLYSEDGLNFTVHCKAELDQALDQHDSALEALCPGTVDVAGEVRKDCYRPFVVKWSRVDGLKDESKYRWQLVYKQLKHIDRVDSTHRIQGARFISCGSLRSPSTEALVAHSLWHFCEHGSNRARKFADDRGADFHGQALDAVKILDGRFEHHNGRCEHEGECEPPTLELINANILAIETEIQAAGESIAAERAAYEYLPRREWLNSACEFRLIPEWTKPGHCAVWKRKLYVSPYPQWKRPTQKAHGTKCHQPNAEWLLQDGYTGNSQIPEWTKGFGKVRKLKLDSNGEIPFIQVDFEHYKATDEIVLRQVEFKKAARPTKEQLEWADKVTGLSAEPRGEKFIKKKSSDKAVEEDESNYTGDDEEKASNTFDDLHISDDGGTKENNPLDHETLEAGRRWMRGKAEAGEFHNFNDDAEFTREQNGVKVNIKNKEFIRTNLVMQWLFENPTKDPDGDGEWIHNAAEKTGLSESGLRTWFARAFAQIKEMEEMRDWKEIPNIPVTYDQAVDIVDNRATYVLLELNGWRWHRLDIEKHGTFDLALEALRAEKIMDALAQRLKKAGIQTRGKTVGELPKEYGEIFKDVKSRYDKVFHPDRIRVKYPPNPRWAGLIGE